MDRRDFLKTAGIAAASTTLLNTASIARGAKSYQWNMVTSWPPGLAVLHDGPVQFAKRVNEMTGGRLTIKVYAGGELVPPLGVFEAVSQGMVQCGHSASYYWAGKAPAAQWFTSVPFGLSSTDYNTWLYAGNGLQLWEEVYAPFSIIPRPMGDTGAQMFGWFNKEINTINDLKGLKIRMPGLAGRVLAKAGAAVVLIPGGEIYTSIERGAIDAVNWIGPAHDMKMGFHKVTKYYYGPGWQEPSGRTELMINKEAYESLPTELQKIVDVAAAEADLAMQAQFELINSDSLNTLRKTKGIKLMNLSLQILGDLKKLTNNTLAEAASENPMSTKVHKEYTAFQDKIQRWGSFSQVPYS